jgi:hypothetical protein
LNGWRIQGSMPTKTEQNSMHSSVLDLLGDFNIRVTTITRLYRAAARSIKLRQLGDESGGQDADPEALKWLREVTSVMERLPGRAANEDFTPPEA